MISPLKINGKQTHQKFISILLFIDLRVSAFSKFTMVSTRETKNKSSGRRSSVLNINSVRVENNTVGKEIMSGSRGVIKAKQDGNLVIDNVDLLQEPFRSLLEISDSETVGNDGPLRVYDLEVARLCGNERTNLVVLLSKLSESHAHIVVRLKDIKNNNKKRNNIDKVKRSFKETIRKMKGDDNVIRIPSEGHIEVDLAAILILSIALRNDAGSNYNSKIGELIGLAQPSTIKMMQPFYRHPLMDASFIPSLLHGAARHRSQIRGGNDNKRAPLDVATYTSNAVASLLQSPIPGLEEPISWFRERFEEIFKNENWTSDVDRGIQAGLILIGEKKFLRGRVKKVRDNTDLGLTALKFAHGAASGAPLAGFVAAALEPFFESYVLKLSEKQEAVFQNIWTEVERLWRNDFEDGIVNDGKVKLSSGKEIPVNWAEFDKHFKQAFRDDPSLS
jgi:hypothetical protein